MTSHSQAPAPLSAGTHASARGSAAAVLLAAAAGLVLGARRLRRFRRLFRARHDQRGMPLLLFVFLLLVGVPLVIGGVLALCGLPILTSILIGIGGLLVLLIALVIGLYVSGRKADEEA